MKARVWHIIILFSAVLFAGNISLLADIAVLLYVYMLFLLHNFGAAIKQFNLELAGLFASLFFIIIIPAAAFTYRNRHIFSARLSFNSLILIVLAYFFIFAPLIAGTNPDFQRDLGLTKLLPPMSSLKVIHLKAESASGKNFFDLRNQIVQRSYNSTIIFADSVKEGGKIYYYQKLKSFEIAPNEVVFKQGRPYITSKMFPLGTDEYGRDVFSRLVYGARVSLFVGLGAVFITLFLGVVLGFSAGYAGGIIDTILSRITDMLLAFPIIFLVILILALFGNSLFTVIAVLGYSGWMSLFKIVRGEVISIKQKEYFISARLSGLSGKNLLLREIFPVILAPVIVNLVLQYGNVILAESALSYLGLGTGNLYPSWGGMMESGQEYLTEAWWLIFFPGLALFVTLFTANNLGKELNLFFNPRLMND